MSGNYMMISAELLHKGINFSTSLIMAIAIFIAGLMLSNWLNKIIKQTMGKISKIDPMLISLAASSAKYAVLIFTIIIILGNFGIQTASIIAVIGAAGLAVGLALQGTLQNIAAGIMLILLRPFTIGDYIESNSASGTVKDIGLFTTIFQTFDGIYLSVPNSKLWGGYIKNYSRNKTRRIDIEIGIAYEDDANKAMKLLEKLMNKDKRILKDPEPQTMISALADSSVNINMRMWVNTSDYWATLFDMRLNAKKEIEKAGMSIPFPQRDIHIIENK